MQTEMQQQSFHNYYSRQQCMIVVTYVNCHLLEYTTDIDQTCQGLQSIHLQFVLCPTDLLICLHFSLNGFYLENSHQLSHAL